MSISKFQEKVLSESNPSDVAISLSSFISKSLRDNHISLYEGLMLKDSEMSLLRQCYLKPAYSHGVSRSILLSLIMIYLTADYFKQPALVKKYQTWINEAFQKLGEIREHFTDKLIDLVLSDNKDELKAAIETIASGEQDHDDGPFPEEVYPYCLPWLKQEVKKSDLELSADVAELVLQIDIEFI